MLNALSAFISPKERIVTIEDAAELQLKQPHVVRLETRPANLEGQGAVRQRQLLINSLRMRPDRIVVGEVRGEEALDMLQAMNTGHDGSLTTVHANGPRDAISRLEVMISLANANMQMLSIRQQIASAVHLLVQVARMSDGSRRVINITEVTGMEGEVITLQDIFVFEKRGLSPEGKVMGRFAATGIRPKFADKLAGGRHSAVAGPVRSGYGRLRAAPMAVVILIFVVVVGVTIGLFLLLDRKMRQGDLATIKSRLLGTPAKKAKRTSAQPVLMQTDDAANRSLVLKLLRRFEVRRRLQGLLDKAGRAMECHAPVQFVAGRLAGRLRVGLVCGAATAQPTGPAGGPAVRRHTGVLHRPQGTIAPGQVRGAVPGGPGVRGALHAGRTRLLGVARDAAPRVRRSPGGEFRRTFDEQNLGLPLEVALEKLATRIPLLDVHFFVSAVLLQKRTGGNLAEVLEKLAYLIRERFKLRGRMRAISAHGRLTGTVLSLIPAAVGGVMFYVNPDYVLFFVRDTIGHWMLGGAIALQLVGYAVIKKIVSIEV